LFPRPVPLSPEETRRHGDAYVRGWRLKRLYPESEVALHVLVDQDFPYSLPRVALADPPPPLTWPHVEANGMLCLAPSSTTVSTEYPDDAVRVLRDNVLKDAFDLVGNLLAGGLEDHFLDEFHAYWTRGERANGRSVLSLLTLTPSSRQVAVFSGKESYLVGDTAEACETWLRHFHGTVDEKYTTERAAYIWLRRPPYPKEYPLRRGHLGAVVKDLSSDGFAVLTSLLTDEPSSLVIVLASEWKGQRELGGLLLVKPEPSSGHRGYDTDVLRPGFRPGKVPPSFLAARYIGSANAPLRSDVKRVDHRWINGKDRNPSTELLTGKRVCILGCGSLGAGVSRLLAQSGVGILHLVDHDSLDWPNTSRQVLGARDVDRHKAPALAQNLGRDFPHLLAVQGHRVRWQDLPSREQFLAGFDLLISVTGDWNSDAALSDVQRADTTFPPVLFGWLEPHAAAAHALLLGATEACLRCGMAPNGSAIRPVTMWPPQPQRAEGDCAAPYSPYGAVELAIGQSVVSQLALDYLLGKSRPTEHRVWVGNRDSILSAGGSWSDAWVRAHSDPGAGQQVYRDDWPIRADCTRHAAA
jgi:hypothetical protein